MKTVCSAAVARPVALIAIVLAVLISESVDATSVLRGTPCDDQQPVQADIDYMIERFGIDRPEFLVLVSHGCIERSMVTGPTTMKEWSVRSYTIAWPKYVMAGELSIYNSAACSFRDENDPVCLIQRDMAKWAGGKLFRFEWGMDVQELNELAMVLKQFFDADVDIQNIYNEKSSQSQWRTGSHSYKVTIGQRPNMTQHIVSRDCETIDRCKWDISNSRRLTIAQ